MRSPAELATAIAARTVGLVEVTKDSFYAAVGPLNAGGTIVSGYDADIGYVSDWHMLSGPKCPAFATTLGGTHVCATRYFVTQSFLDANSTVLVRA